MCERPLVNMDEILACRVCLATDVKLFDVFSNKLVSPYEMITGTRISPTDGLPHKTCGQCGVALLKHAAFTERCLNSQELLFYLAKREKITTEMVCHMDRSNFSPQPHLTIEAVYSTAAEDAEDKIKEEDTIDYNQEVDLGIDNDQDVDLGIDNDIKSEESDEEPLAKKIERKNGYDAPLIKKEFDKVPEIDLMFLSKEEQVEELRKRMSSLNYMNSLYKCEFCYKGFMTDVTYKNHMLRHDPKAGKYPCAVCRTYCPSLRALRGHAATAHERRYLCRLCAFVTKSGSRAREHSRWHAGHTFSCQLCGATFGKSTSYLTHVRLRHPSQHCCALCGDSFIGRHGLNMHVKKAHRLQEQPPAARCQCGVAFASDAALHTHRQRDYCDTRHRPCVQCGESFLSDDALSEHVKAAHGSEGTKCEECDKSFSSERSLSTHRQRIHLGLRVKRRGARRDTARKLVCELCGKACHSAASLQLHQRTHSGERPFACAHCPKTFSNLQLLQIHTRTHTGERPYACAVCAKAFVHKAGLNRHVRVHTGEKPYACAHCGKAFSQSNSMKLHVNTVHLKLPAPYRPRKKDSPVS